MIISENRPFVIFFLLIFANYLRICRVISPTEFEVVLYLNQMGEFNFIGEFVCIFLLTTDFSGPWWILFLGKESDFAMMDRKESKILLFCLFKPFGKRKNWFREKRTGLFCDSIDFNPSKVERKPTLKVHKNENFFGFDFEFCTISLLVMSKY
jgi:hypothetical protein